MLIQRRINVAKEGQTEKLAALITGWFAQRNPFPVTRVFVVNSDMQDQSGANPNHVIIEHESENLAAFEASVKQWQSGVTEEDKKAWGELVEEMIVENWTVCGSYEKREIG